MLQTIFDGALCAHDRVAHHRWIAFRICGCDSSFFKISEDGLCVLDRISGLTDLFEIVSFLTLELLSMFLPPQSG